MRNVIWLMSICSQLWLAGECFAATGRCPDYGMAGTELVLVAIARVAAKAQGADDATLAMDADCGAGDPVGGDVCHAVDGCDRSDGSGDGYGDGT